MYICGQMMWAREEDKMVYCVAFGCRNGTHNKSMFIFPKDKHIRKLWTERVKRDGWTPSEYSRFWYDHFKDEDFVVLQRPVHLGIHQKDNG